jgi:hypothetical protein
VNAKLGGGSSQRQTLRLRRNLEKCLILKTESGMESATFGYTAYSKLLCLGYLETGQKTGKNDSRLDFSHRQTGVVMIGEKESREKLASVFPRSRRQHKQTAIALRYRGQEFQRSVTCTEFRAKHLSAMEVTTSF